MVTFSIEIQNLHKSFKDTKAVDGVDLQVPEGTFLALLGPNGAGKTTLVEMVEGIQKPDQGMIHILGKNWKEHENEIRKLLGFSLQETRFIDKLTVWETLRLFASFYSANLEIAKSLLEISGLSSKTKTYVEHLSGGQRQKLALCIALVHEPKILILDEPTTGLDPTARREIWDILLKLKSKSTTLILTTHYMEEAEKLCDTIVFIDKGRIVSQGSMTEILSKSEMGEYIDLKFGNKTDFSFPKMEFIKKFQWSDDKKSVKVFVSNTVLFLEYFLSQKDGLNITSLECKKMNLDDYFLAMTGRKLED
jgi:ABC-2 type transport system ATP-binding protein